MKRKLRNTEKRSAFVRVNGDGLLLSFRVDDFDAALARACSLVGTLAEEPGMNPSTGAMEFALRDPDGYYVMLSDT